MFAFSPIQTRRSNAPKLDPQLFYTPPFRRAIPWTLCILVAFQTCVFGTALAFAILDSVESGGIAFLHWVLIPLILLAVSLVDVVRRFQRTLSPLQATISGIVLSSLWFVYIFLGLLPDFVDFLFAILAAPGLAASLVYLILASLAFVRQRKHGGAAKNVGTTTDFELAPRAGPQAASTRSASSSKMAQQQAEPIDQTAVDPESQSWSPLR